MRHFIIAVLTGLLFALVGFGIVMSLFTNMDLSCRDCQGAAGVILLGSLAVIVVFFISGAILGGTISYRRRKARLNTHGIEVHLNAPSESDLPGSSVDRPDLKANFDGSFVEPVKNSAAGVPARVKIVIALLLVLIILVAFFYNAFAF